MSRLGTIAGIFGFVALLSVPFTLFLWDWRVTWVVIAKIGFGVFAILGWWLTNRAWIKITFQGRSVFYGTFSVLYVVVGLGVLLVLNLIAYYHPARIDLTKNEIHSLSDQTQRVLQSFDDQVQALAFYGSGHPMRQRVQFVLNTYRVESDRFDFEFVDPETEPNRAARYKVVENGPRIVLLYQKRQERVRLFAAGHSSPEEALTTALMKLVADKEPAQICFSTGHGENPLGTGDPRRSLSHWVRDLGGEGYRSESLALLELPEVPSACSAVVVSGPSKDLGPEEIESLERYLDSGGRLMALAGIGDSVKLNDLLSKRGLRFGADSVISLGGRSPYMVVTDPRLFPRSHPIFSRFFGGGSVDLRQLQAIFWEARSVRVGAQRAGSDVTELVFSPERAWGESDDVKVVEAVEFDPETDLKGPVALAAVAKLDGGGRLAVFGSSRLAVDRYYGIRSFNRDLVMNSVAWLLSDEAKISIRPRSRAASMVRLEASDLKFVTFFAADILPLLILALGLTIWQVRRFK
jgi:ABC-type uncharacterized transport system involved in gliding motility auxiliary subunit